MGRPRRRASKSGAAAAAAILALRADDGSDTLLLDFDYPQGDEPGEYRFTPGTPFAFAPGWGDVTPFVLKSSSQFPVRPPYAVTSKKYTKDFNEVKDLGGDGVTTPSDRTTDETEIALFWVESSPLAWNRIARTVSADRGLDMWENARLFGLLNMAMADGYVGTFEIKYDFNFWRPVTAIQLADTDGNPNTEVDPTWTPLVQTPPIPDHDSGHSVQGGVAAQVLRRFFGDQTSFEALQHDAAGREQVYRHVVGDAFVHQLHPGVGGERALTHPRGVPLPQRGRARDQTRHADRRSCRQPVHGSGGLAQRARGAQPSSSSRSAESHSTAIRSCGRPAARFMRIRSSREADADDEPVEVLVGGRRIEVHEPIGPGRRAQASPWDPRRSRT